MQIDFYILDKDTPSALELFACRIIEKAYKRGHKVFVFCENMHATHTVDELLWTYKADSFIPHNIQGEGPEPPPMVQIGHSDEPRGFNDILLNLSHEIPRFYKKFSRVIEIVENTESAKEISRNHFREYKKQGYKLQTHNINL
ncbi:MAG: DNA polymerase III subunit chi [Legionellaceae bacterium]|nr:DNA polymerase III subunit chi [Legionellaceae bacterium]